MASTKWPVHVCIWNAPHLVEAVEHLHHNLPRGHPGQQDMPQSSIQGQSYVVRCHQCQVYLCPDRIPGPDMPPMFVATSVESHWHSEAQLRFHKVLKASLDGLSLDFSSLLKPDRNLFQCGVACNAGASQMSSALSWHSASAVDSWILFGQWHWFR